MSFFETISHDWAGFLPVQKAFYGIGGLAAFVIVLLGLFQLVGMEVHTDLDHPDHHGASLFSIKPLTGFFFGFGWAGGYGLGRMAFLPAAALAVVAGTAFMLTIWGIIRLFVHFQNDGSMNLASAVGREGTVYTTIHPAKGGRIQVILNTGLETLPAVTRETTPISTGQTISVIRIDGPNLLVESKKS